MVQVPVVTKLNAPALVIVHTPVVLEVKLTVRLELAVAVSVGAVPKVCVPGLLNVIVCANCPTNTPAVLPTLLSVSTALLPALS